MKKSLCILLCMCCLCLQAQQRYFTVDVRHAAEIRLPNELDNVQAIMLVNNCTEQPATFGHQNKLNDEAVGSDSINLREAPKQMLFGMLSSLDEQNRWSDISLLETSQSSNRNFYRKSPLSRQRADSIIDIYGVEALLVLNQLVVYDLREMYITDRDTWYAYLEAYCSAQWTIHKKGRNGAFTFVTADTLRWAGEDHTPTAVWEQLPDRQTALLDFSYYAGQEAGKKLSAQWVQEDRYLYQNKNEEIMAGLDAFRRQQWSDAISHWENAARSVDKQTRAYALANIAIGKEMMGAIAEAISYVDKAIGVFAQSNSSESIQQRVNLNAYKNQLRALPSTQP